MVPGLTIAKNGNFTDYIVFYVIDLIIVFVIHRISFHLYDAVFSRYEVKIIVK